jgi:hypothetical protein
MSELENLYAAPEYEPYVRAIGQLALAWNDLQEELAGIFSTLMNHPPREGDARNTTPSYV